MSKYIFNKKWETNLNGIRKIELDNFSGIPRVSLDTYGARNPVTASTTPSVNLFIVRKRIIRLMDCWNRIINSGLFLEARETYIPEHKTTYQDEWIYSTPIGQNYSNGIAEFPFKYQWVSVDHISTRQAQFDSNNVHSEIADFLKTLTLYINEFEASGERSIPDGARFLYKYSSNIPLTEFLNLEFNLLDSDFLDLCSELLNIILGLYDMDLVLTDFGYSVSDLHFKSTQARTNVGNLLTTTTSGLINFKKYAKKDASYLKDGLVPTDKYNIRPQFGVKLTGTDVTVKNVILKTPTLDKFGQIDYRIKNELPCTMLQATKPLLLASSQFINWDDPEDHPYIMSYNGSKMVSVATNSLGIQPLYQMNLSAAFWKIGTTDETDPNYNNMDDIKLDLEHPLHELTKLDYLDNLVIYLKLD